MGFFEKCLVRRKKKKKKKSMRPQPAAQTRDMYDGQHMHQSTPLNHSYTLIPLSSESIFIHDEAQEAQWLSIDITCRRINFHRPQSTQHMVGGDISPKVFSRTRTIIMEPHLRRQSCDRRYHMVSRSATFNFYPCQSTGSTTQATVKLVPTAA